MARSKLNPTASVTFRMQEVTLQKIDNIAAQNNHDRTTEINDACRYWIELGGSANQDSAFMLKKSITALQNQINDLEKNMTEMAASLKQLEENNSTLLRIIEKMTGK